MKKLVTFVLVLMIIVPSMLIGANASTLEEELSAQMFDYFGGNEADLSYIPSDVPPVFLGDCVEVDDMVIFSAYAVWMGADCAEVAERYGDCCVWSGEITYPSHTGMFVRKDGEIYTLKETWENGIVTDLSPAVGFSEYARVYHIGDADLDYEVSVLDATLIQMEIAKTAPLGKQSIFEVNDVDNDGDVSVLDATAIQLKIARIE